jgi:hypothetical protein
MPQGRDEIVGVLGQTQFGAESDRVPKTNPYDNFTMGKIAIAWTSDFPSNWQFINTSNPKLSREEFVDGSIPLLVLFEYFGHCKLEILLRYVLPPFA